MHPSRLSADLAMVLDPARCALSNLYLVGPMGSGKTTLGRRVATELGLKFIDCDREIEQQTGVSINLIFDIEGESGFRQRETEVLRRIAEGSGQLVATGGGAVTRAVNRELMRESGFIVWLRTTVQRQIDRLGRDRSRPLLQTPDRERRLEGLAKERNPLYSELADLVFDSSQHNVNRVASQLCAEIRRHWQPVQGSPAHETD